jgi:hypothetical protein
MKKARGGLLNKPYERENIEIGFYEIILFVKTWMI